MHLPIHLLSMKMALDLNLISSCCAAAISSSKNALKLFGDLGLRNPWGNAWVSAYWVGTLCRLYMGADYAWKIAILWIADTEIHLVYPGPPSFRSADPPGFKHGGKTGEAVSFLVIAWSYPAAQFQWTHIMDDSMSIDLPSDNTDTQSKLTIQIEGKENYGNYSVAASNSLGKWEDITFFLVPEGKNTYLTRIDW